MFSCIIVDDELFFGRRLSQYIEEKNLGFSVLGVFSDGEDAIEFIKTEHVDLILTDVKMKKASGIDLAKYIFDNGIDTNILFISAYSEFEYAQQAITYNVVEYLTKPIDYNLFNAALTKIAAKLKLIHNNKMPEIVKEAFEDDSSSISAIKSDIIVLAKHYIDEHYSSSISLQEVANHVYLSPVYFSRIFSDISGESFSSYLTSVRMNKAISLLALQTKIDDIAKITGYSSGKYFSKMFKKYFGLSPIDYYRTKIIGGEKDG